MKALLLSFPFAGGAKHSFRFIKENISEGIEHMPFEYPGHGVRIKETPANSYDEIIDDVLPKVKHLLYKPYAIYGHSMGATVSYLLCQKIRLLGLPLPLRIFISGTDAPSVPPKKIRHHLSKSEFIEEIRRLGGLPDDIINSPELLDYFEPLLRADFRITEIYNYEKVAPLNIPITIMFGEDEDMEEADILKWQEESVYPIKVKKFKGNHFFIYENAKEISDIINNEIIEDMSA